MEYTKLGAMNYAVDVLQEKFNSMKDKGTPWGDQDFENCRIALNIIGREVKALAYQKAIRQQERNEKWRLLLHAIKRYSNEWYTAFDLYTLIKDEIGDAINFSSFYSRLNQCWCIASEKKGKQERVYKFMPDRYKNEYGEI